MTGITTENVALPDKEKYFLTTVLKQFEDISEPDSEESDDDDAKSQTSTMTTPETCAPTMVIEDIPDEDEDTVNLIMLKDGTKIKMKRKDAQKIISTASPEKRKEEKVEKQEKHVQGHGHGRGSRRGGAVRRGSAKVTKQTKGKKKTQVEEAEEEFTDEEFKKEYLDYWDIDVTELLVGKNVLLGKETEQKLRTHRENEKTNIVLRIKDKKERLKRIKEFDDNMMKKYTQKKGRTDETQTEGKGSTTQVDQTEDPLGKDDGQNKKGLKSGEKDTTGKNTDDVIEEETEALVTLLDEDDDQETPVERRTDETQTEGKDSKEKRTKAKCPASLKRPLSDVLSLTPGVKKSKQTKLNKNVVRSLWEDWDDDEDDELDPEEDVNIIPSSGTPNPVRVEKQKRLLLGSRGKKVPYPGNPSVSELGFDVEPATASSSATSASGTTPVDLGLVKTEKTEEEESRISDVILVVDEEDIPISVRKRYLREKCAECSGCKLEPDGKRCFQHRVKFFEIMCSDPNQDLDTLDATLQEEIKNCDDCKDVPLTFKVCTLHMAFLNKLQVAKKRRLTQQHAVPYIVKQEPRDDDEEGGNGNSGNKKGPGGQNPEQSTTADADSGYPPGVLNIMPRSQSNEEDAAEAWSLEKDSETTVQVGAKIGTQHLEPATQPFEISKYFGECIDQMSDSFQAKCSTEATDRTEKTTEDEVVPSTSDEDEGIEKDKSLKEKIDCGKKVLLKEKDNTEESTKLHQHESEQAIKGGGGETEDPTKLKDDVHTETSEGGNKSDNKDEEKAKVNIGERPHLEQSKGDNESDAEEDKEAHGGKDEGQEKLGKTDGDENESDDQLKGNIGEPSNLKQDKGGNDSEAHGGKDEGQDKSGKTDGDENDSDDQLKGNIREPPSLKQAKGGNDSEAEEDKSAAEGKKGQKTRKTLKRGQVKKTKKTEEGTSSRLSARLQRRKDTEAAGERVYRLPTSRQLSMQQQGKDVRALAGVMNNGN